MLRWFVSVNRRAARKLEEKYPRFFVESRNFGDDFRAMVRKTLEEKQPKVILEVGGVDRPALQKSPDYAYIGLDIDAQENCYVVYDKFIHGSIEDKTDLDGVELVISKAVFEHVPDNTRAFQALYDVMHSGSVMHHYIPSGFHPYSIALKIVGDKPQKWLIRNLRPRQDAINTTGYPAFFNHCDPISMRKLLERTGFRDADFIIYYKATDYFAFFLPAYLMVATFENLASKMGWEICASGMVVTATKP
jgi:hypothetical protein